MNYINYEFYELSRVCSKYKGFNLGAYPMHVAQEYSM